MGASALISALNALPWEGEESDRPSSDEEDVRPRKRSATLAGKIGGKGPKSARPKGE